MEACAGNRQARKGDAIIMKKYILHNIISLALALLCFAIPACAESTPEGDWYAVWQGLPLHLTLNGDGSFSLRLSLMDAGPSQGTWELENDRVILNGDQENALAFDGKTLASADGALSLSRQAQESPFSPAPDADAELAAFSGQWEARYVNAFGAVLPMEALRAPLTIWIDENMSALDGAGIFFGDVMDFDYAEGVLRKELGAEDATLSLELRMLQDGSLRFTVTAQNDALTFYLERVEKNADTATE